MRLLTLTLPLFIFSVVSACVGPIAEINSPCWANTCCQTDSVCSGGVCTSTACRIENARCDAAFFCCSEFTCSRGVCTRGSLRTTTTPAPTTSSDTTPTNTLTTSSQPNTLTTTSAPIPSGQIRGYYSWSWTDVNNPPRPRGPANANMGVAFSGWNSAERALGDYDPKKYRCCPPLPANKWVSIGGGNANGHFTVPVLEKLITPESMNIIKNSDYVGVMLDVEELVGPASSLIPLFKKFFELLKQEGKLIGVTTSHTGPYIADTPKDAFEVIRFCTTYKDMYILSPQLYSYSGDSVVQLEETYFCKAAGCVWGLFANTTAKVVPSVIDESHYTASLNFFSLKGIKIEGFIQWTQ